MTAKRPLAEAARLICGEACTLRDPERWVRERLLDPGYPDFRGQKIGRDWYMTDADIRRAELSLYTKSSSKPTAPDEAASPTSLIDGLSARGRRRLQNAS